MANEVGVVRAFYTLAEIDIDNFGSYDEDCFRFAQTGAADESRSLASGFSVTVRGPDGLAWRGVFQEGGFNRGLHGVYSSPAPWHICVLASGVAYHVDVRDPMQYVCLHIVPCIAATWSHDVPFIALADDTHICGINVQGSIWHSGRIASDGIRGLAILAGRLHGQAWCAPRSRWEAFVLDVLTGDPIVPTLL